MHILYLVCRDKGFLLQISVKASEIRRLVVSGAMVELKRQLVIIQKFRNLIGDSTANVCPEHSSSDISIAFRTFQLVDSNRYGKETDLSR